MILTTHAQRQRNPVAEAGLWLVWTLARLTGAGTLIAGTRARLGQLASAVRRGTHRAALRAELAAAEFLTGPAADAIGKAKARFERRAPFILAAVFVFASLIPAAIR